MRITTCCVLVLLGIGLNCLSQSSKIDGQAENLMRLWYPQPANGWIAALPVGNGRLGAMVFGGVERELIPLNEDSFWSGEPGNNVLSEVEPYLQEIRGLIYDGKYQEAQKLASQYLPNLTPPENGDNGKCYQPKGTHIIDFPGINRFDNYHRSLDISRAVSTVRFTAKNVNYKRKVLSSFTDNVLVVHLSADKAGSIHFSLKMEGQLLHTVKTEKELLLAQGKGGDFEGKKGKVTATTLIKPKLKGGELISNDSTLSIKGADEVTLYISISTKFNSY